MGNKREKKTRTLEDQSRWSNVGITEVPWMGGWNKIRENRGETIIKVIMQENFSKLKMMCF